MTAFEPVLAACSAWKSKRVYASPCVDCTSATSTHSSAVILKQVSSQVTYNALPCSIYLYRCRFHSPAKNLRRLVLLKELNRNCLHCCMCMLCPPACICIEGVCLNHQRVWMTKLRCVYLGWVFQIFWWTAGGMRQRQHQPYHSVHLHTVP